jgi:hypothetical protein
MSWRPFPITLDAMNFPPRKTPLRLTAAAAAACLLLTGCEPTDSGSSSPAAVGQVNAGTTGPTGGLCPPPGPKVSKVLPDLTSSGIRTVMTNPCVPFSGLVAAVMGVVTEEEPARRSFKPVLEDFIDKIDKANALVECAYRTDTLGIRVYQQDHYAWSVGLVVVIRDNPSAPFDIAACFLTSSFGFRSEGTTSPRFQPCWKGSRVSRADGETFTVLWAGSSDVVCRELQKSAT